MTDDQYNPFHPKWDTSKPGKLPHDLAAAVADSRRVAKAQEKMVKDLAKLKPDERLMQMERDAQGLALSPVSALGEESSFIYGWERHRQVAQAGLESATNYDYIVENREFKIETYRQRLALAFLKLGHLDAATAVARACASPAELQDYIARVKAAIDKPDEELETHPCPRVRSKIKGPDGREVEIELDRHFDSDQVMSARHGKLVHLWKCSVCGEVNATPEAPARHRLNAQDHARIDADFRAGRSLVTYHAGRLLRVNDGDTTL